MQYMLKMQKQTCKAVGAIGLLYTGIPRNVNLLQTGAGICAVLTGNAVTIGEVNKLVRPG